MLRRNVLIFHQAALGDFVLTWPIALAVARILPQSRVIYVTAVGKGKLAEAVLRVESIDAEQGWHALLQSGVTREQLPPTVLRAIDAAQMAIVFCAAGSDAFADALRRLQPDLRIIEIVTTPLPPQHLADTLVAQAAAWQPLEAASVQILAGIRQRGLSVARKAVFDVLIHPGSGGRAKCWPLESFLETARLLQARGKVVQFVLGEVELEQYDAAALQTLAAVAPVARLHEATELLHMINRSTLFLGNDSGPTHLAAIVGTPTVAIFGPTDPAVWMPIGPRVTAIRGEPIESVHVETVMAAIERLA